MNSILEKLLAEYSPEEDDKERAVCVVRVTTSNYMSSGQIVFKKTLRVLKRKSQLSLSENGIDDMEHVVIDNLNEVEDGIYELQPSEYDWDVDEYTGWGYPVRWKLVPFQ